MRRIINFTKKVLSWRQRRRDRIATARYEEIVRLFGECVEFETPYIGAKPMSAEEKKEFDALYDSMVAYREANINNHDFERLRKHAGKKQETRE
jgi:hypothetical protein